uniref:G-protein coupled receptors family 1 profile domain-containing protein n=1 Tax=Acrobeloides nanus TaxID=290746 RepID=A0A914DBY4_9BILA
MPAMNYVIRLEPSISGCNAYSCGTLTAQLIAATEGLAVLAIPVSIVVIIAIYIKRMKYLATQNMSNATMKSNRMLMKSLVIHIAIIVVFLVIPVIMFIGIAVIANEEYNIILE